MQSTEPGGDQACTSSTHEDVRGNISCGETSSYSAESNALLEEHSSITEPPHSCNTVAHRQTVTRRRKQGASATRSTVKGTAKADEAVRWTAGRIRLRGLGAFRNGLKIVEETHKVRPKLF